MEELTQRQKKLTNIMNGNAKDGIISEEEKNIILKYMDNEIELRKYFDSRRTNDMKFQSIRDTIYEINLYYQKLKEYFKFDTFKYGQLECISEIMSNRNCLFIIKTGGGKSLTFQLPAMISSRVKGRTTVIISFLLALTKDQIFNFEKYVGQFNQMKVCRFDSTMNMTEKSQIINNIKNGLSYDMIYVTPETFLESTFQSLMEILVTSNKFARLVIDEVHLIKQWGESFRPAVLRIGDIKNNPAFSRIQIVGFTATANERTKMFLLNNLRINNSSTRTIKLPLNRPNITYRFKCLSGNACLYDARDCILSFKEKFKRLPRCISYVWRTSTTESYARIFSGIMSEMRPTFFHSGEGMTEEKKSRNYFAWNSDGVNASRMIFATIAFGLGIDANVDIVFIMDVKTLDMLIQEAGRVGRNGEQSYCYVYVNFGVINATPYVRKADRDDENDSPRNTNTQEEQEERMLINKVCKISAPFVCRRKLLLTPYSKDEVANMDCFKGENASFEPCDNCAYNAANAKVPEKSKYAFTKKKIFKKK